jgi:hypothetical protein
MAGTCTVKRRKEAAREEAAAMRALSISRGESCSRPRASGRARETMRYAAVTAGMAKKKYTNGHVVEDGSEVRSAGVTDPRITTGVSAPAQTSARMRARGSGMSARRVESAAWSGVPNANPSSNHGNDTSAAEALSPVVSEDAEPSSASRPAK